MVGTQAEYNKTVATLNDWITAAIADGWATRPTYQNEPIERAMTLVRAGWHVSTLRRPPEGRRKGEVSLSMWADDGLTINAPIVYNWEELLQLKRVCNYCQTRDVDTERVGFAGRCCVQCLPAQRKRIETPGWTS